MRFSDKPGKDQTKVTRALEDCSRWIESQTKQFFNKDASAVDRIFMPKTRYTSYASNYPQIDWAESENPWLYGGLARVLDIDPVVSISSITVDESRDNTFSRTLTTNDYELLPRNATLGPEPEPYRQIMLTQWGSFYGWPSQARVKVHGIFGWPSVPAGIRSGCVELVGILMGDSPLSTRAYTDMGAVGASAEAKGIVLGLLSSHTRSMAF